MENDNIILCNFSNSTGSIDEYVHMEFRCWHFNDVTIYIKSIVNIIVT